MQTNKIYNENCLLTLAKMPDNSIDLVVTSPPYNMRTRVRNGKYTTREKSEHFSKKYKHFGDDLKIEDFYNFHSQVIRELLRISSIICYNFQIVTGSKEAFFKIIGDFNKYIKDIIIWDKLAGQPAMHANILNSCYEFILILESNAEAGRLIKNSYFNRGEMNNIIRIGNKKNDVDEHNAVFPEKLAATLINAFSKEGDIIYDPFGGTATTAIAALKLNRKYIISEISPEYCEIAQKRINIYNSQIKLFN